MGQLKTCRYRRVLPSTVLRGGAAPGSGLERTGLRAVDRFAVGLHPLADGVEPFQRGGGDLALGRRADVQQVVAPLGGDVDNVPYQRFGLFQWLSSRLKPQVSFMVMHDSQSSPGRPLAGICCSGVPKSPEYA